MVKTLHQAGIEVILDVVYNHTARGQSPRSRRSASGASTTPATTAWCATNRRYYMDYTGCGNTLNMTAPPDAPAHHGQPALLGAGDACRRLPLRPGLGPGPGTARRGSPGRLLRHHSPGSGPLPGEADRRAVGPGRGGLPGRKLPRPLGGVERRVSGHGPRATGRGTRGRRGRSGTASPARSDLYGKGGRRPYASINFVTAHDGFTLHDLVSYNDKHNEANGEENRDGSDDNLSWNCGGGGPHRTSAESSALRERQKRNFLATLLLSQGVPMLCGGDEIGRTQQRQQQRLLPGQRDELARLEARPGARKICWPSPGAHPAAPRPPGAAPAPVLLRPAHPGLRGQGPVLVPAGRQGDDRGGLARSPHALPRPAAGSGTPSRRWTPGATPITDDTFLVLLNAHHEPVPFVLPAHRRGVRWEILLDTRERDGRVRRRLLRGGAAYSLAERSVALFRMAPPREVAPRRSAPGRPRP